MNLPMTVGGILTDFLLHSLTARYGMVRRCAGSGGSIIYMTDETGVGIGLWEMGYLPRYLELLITHNGQEFIRRTR